MKTIEKKICELKKELGLITMVECTKNEKEAIDALPVGSPLPDGIQYNPADGTYLKEGEIDMTPEEKEEFYVLKKLSYLKSIKGYLKFFTVLTVLALIGGAVLLIAGGSVISGLLY